MIIEALIPVKAAAAGKERLARALPPEARAALVRAMLRDVVTALRGSVLLRRVAVTSPDADMLALASALGALPLAEPSGTGGLNGALATALARLSRDGADAVLIVQGDLPQIRPADVAAILGLSASARDGDSARGGVAGEAPAFAPTPSGCQAIAVESGCAAPGATVAERRLSRGSALVRAVPSADGGTSALLLVPPDVIAPRFGPDSFDRHRAAAEAAAAPFERCDLPLLAWDVDRPDDLARVLRGGHAPETRAVLLAGGFSPVGQ